MAYTAEIQIAVKGAKELRSFQTELNKSSDAVDRLNRDIKTLSEGGIPRSFNNLNSLLAVAANNFNKVALGTQEAATAARDYIRAADEVNAGLRERAALLKQVADEERRARLAAAGIREATQYGGPIGPGAASPVALASQLRGRTQQILDERKGVDELTAALAELEERRRLETNAMLDEKAAQVQLNLARQEEQRKFLAGAAQQYQYPIGPSQRSKRFRFEGDVSPERAETALRNKELKEQRRLNQQFFAEEKQQLLELDRLRAANAQKQTQRLQALGKTISGSLSSAAIGGAFPLLFGQSPQAALGGAIGGLLGGAAGGFAGSLLGTALGEIEAAKARTKELALELGFSSTQAKQLATAFELAGRNSDQLQAAIVNIQGLGLSVNETSSAIKIAVELSKEYGGSVEKIAQAFADTLESGKVSVSTLNKFTAQGIPIQEKLADKLGVNRTKLLEMAKDGKVSVQQVTDVLVDMGREAEASADKGKNGFDRFTSAVTQIATAVAGAAGAILKNLVPALDTVLTRLAAIITRATRALSLIADATVGELSSAVFGAGFDRGTGFGNKGNIDAIGKALANLRPEVATNREELDKIATAAGSAQIELGKFGGALGTYAEQTAQKQLSRVQASIVKRRQELGAPTAAGIVDINAPVNLPPSGGGGGADKAAKAAAREQARVAELIRSQRLITLEYQRQQDFNAKIFAAEMAKDPMLARRLEGERQLVEWGIETADLLEKEASAAGKLAITKAQQAKQGVIRQKIEQDIAKLEKERKDNARRTVEGLQNELAIKNAVTQAERDRLRIAYEMKVLEEDKQFDANQLEQIKQLKEQLAAPALGADLIRQQIGTLTDELTKLTDLGTQVTVIAEGIGSAFANSFKGAVSGAMTAQEALASFFQSVADRFLDMAAQIIAKWIEMTILNSVLNLFPGGGMGLGGATAAAGKLNPAVGFGVGPIGFRAAGGPVSAGSPYIVGERGPELFVPGRSGGIVPNDSLGMGSANVVVNVDASGSNVQGDGNQASQLGKAIGIAVQQELIKQKRPGGLLA